MRIRRICLLIAAVLLLTAAGGLAQSGVDFGSLCAEAGLSEGVCAWLEIPGAGFRMPVMQHPEDGAFYLTHDAQGAESKSGALYTEAAYNAADFTDTATVIYGRRVNDGTMFGSLQEWYSGSFEEHQEILLHLPDGTKRFTAFAAVPYSSIHIMHYYDFSYDRIYSGFVEDICSTRLPGVQLDEGAYPQPGEQMIILSTSLRGDASQRYLVIAKLNDRESN